MILSAFPLETIVELHVYRWVLQRVVNSGVSRGVFGCPETPLPAMIFYNLPQSIIIIMHCQ